MPFTREKIEDFVPLLPGRAESDREWTVTRDQNEAEGCDLRAVNPDARGDEDTLTPEELLNLIRAKGREVAGANARRREGPARGRETGDG